MTRTPLSNSSLQRLPVHYSLYVQTEHTHGIGTLWNVSRAGCRINSPLPLMVGSRVGLLLLYPEPGGPMLVKTASVCFGARPRLGLRLTIMNPAEQHASNDMSHRQSLKMPMLTIKVYPSTMSWPCDPINGHELWENPA